MVHYRRDYTRGAVYFFTLTLQNRQATYLTTHIDALGKAFRDIRKKAFFTTHAIVILPDHLHVIWELPIDDCNYSMRWRLIKTRFTQELIALKVPNIQTNFGASNLWQHRFWEHKITNDTDLQRYIDYIHYNPVKHGHVKKATDWAHSSIHRYIKEKLLSHDWGGYI